MGLSRFYPARPPNTLRRITFAMALAVMQKPSGEIQKRGNETGLQRVSDNGTACGFVGADDDDDDDDPCGVQKY